jgi:hypothetical protein
MFVHFDMILIETIFTFAIARPIPDAAPVMYVIRPSNGFGIDFPNFACSKLPTIKQQNRSSPIVITNKKYKAS